jgi:hypothetical protein
MVVVFGCLQNPDAPATSALHESGAGWVEGQGGVVEVPRLQDPPSIAISTLETLWESSRGLGISGRKGEI